MQGTPACGMTSGPSLCCGVSYCFFSSLRKFNFQGRCLFCLTSFAEMKSLYACPKLNWRESSRKLYFFLIIALEAERKYFSLLPSLQIFWDTWKYLCYISLDRKRVSVDSVQLTIKKSNDSFSFPRQEKKADGVPPVKLIYSKNGLSFLSHQEIITSQ